MPKFLENSCSEQPSSNFHTADYTCSSNHAFPVDAPVPHVISSPKPYLSYRLIHGSMVKNQDGGLVTPGHLPPSVD